MTTGPAVSILMPTFNSGRFLAEAVESAVSQMEGDDELLIQDGASTDGSIDLIRKEYESNPHVRIISEPDGGQADALNIALARAVNPVIGWLNGDDRYYPGALEAFRRGWEKDPTVDLVYGGWTLYSEAGEILRVCVPGQLTRAGLMRTPQIFTGAMFMRATTIREIGGFDRELHYCMDMDLVARILRRGLIPTLVPETLGGFRWYAGSKTGALEFGVVRESLLVRKRYATTLGNQIEAYVFSTTQWIAQAAIPLRRSKLYTSLRTRGAKAERAASLTEP
ncbi:MAG TPA: glycosyltransferase family 2 protein [Acidimicrobiales bacterium]|nr:glycosyltransferase family 2 protein [Acidimicrobiales bacterium]